MNKYFKLILAILCGVILGLIFGFSKIHIELKDWVLIYFGAVIIAMLFLLIRGMKNINALYKGEYSKAIENFEGTIKKHGTNKKITNAMLYNMINGTIL